MSSDRNTNRPLKPTVAANRAFRSPLSPRVAAPTANNARPTVAKTPSVRSEPARVKAPSTPSSNGNNVSGLNITPRSSARKARLTDSATSTPTQDDHTPSALRPRSTIASSQPAGERNGQIGGGLGVSGGVKRSSRPTSLVSEGGGKPLSPMARSPGFFDRSPTSTEDSIDSRFFHASDAPKQEPAVKKADVKKAAAFFYADGKKEEARNTPSQATSPVLSAVEARSSGPGLRLDSTPNPSKSPPMLSPALSSLSSVSPFFAPPPASSESSRPSPPKENIHLSYRKGVSQIFGTRPLQPPRPAEPIAEHPSTPISRKESAASPNGLANAHRKSPSLSSLDSSNSHNSHRRRSATTAEIAPTPSPLAQEVKAATVPRLAARPIASIDTTLEPPASPPGAAELSLSPTKSVSELASDARRERKVLDLEISNSSLLAINASLEREVRRQKAELKRFRRLSRAGRLEGAPRRAARFSEGLSVVGEEGEDEDGADDDDPDELFSPASGLSGMDISEESESEDDDESSLLSSGEDAQQKHRLERDEQRLRLDLARHKELLVQSQMMNRSLKRCMYASENMISEGRRALEYHVRVSDVRLGGRVLSAHGDEADHEGDVAVDGDDAPVNIDVEDDEEFTHPLSGTEARDEHDSAAEDTSMKGFLDVWSSLGGSDVDRDRDSGIEVDHRSSLSQPPRYPLLSYDSLPPPLLGRTSGNAYASYCEDVGRPPGG